MRKRIFIFLLVSASISHASMMRSYRLVWDTSKIASFGLGFGYNFFNSEQFEKPLDVNTRNSQLSHENVFGPIVEAEIGITGYEYSAGVKFGKIQKLANNTYLMTIFTGRAENWKSFKTNIKKNHYVLGVRLNRKFTQWAVKYHTDFKTDKMISIQFGLGE